MLACRLARHLEYRIGDDGYPRDHPTEASASYALRRVSGIPFPDCAARWTGSHLWYGQRCWQLRVQPKVSTPISASLRSCGDGSGRFDPLSVLALVVLLVAYLLSLSTTLLECERFRCLGESNWDFPPYEAPSHMSRLTIDRTRRVLAAGLLRRRNTLRVARRPVASSKAQKSAKVPPISTPIR
jgi:hypothetical protein